MSFDISNAEEVGTFRYDAAGVIKEFILARIAVDPGFISEDQLGRWSLTNVVSKQLSCEYRLHVAKTTLHQFEQKYAVNSASLPVAIAPEYEQICDVMEAVVTFVFGDLDGAIHSAANGSPIDWESLARWGTIPQIRDSLDKIPHPLTSTGVGRKTPSSERRITVNTKTAVVTIDGEPFGLNGSEKVKEQLATFIEDLVDMDGEYLARPEGLKTDHFKKQPKEVRELFDAKRGAGTRIPRDHIWSD